MDGPKQAHMDVLVACFEKDSPNGPSPGPENQSEYGNRFEQWREAPAHKVNV